MLDGHFCHPLDNLIRDDRLFLLEAILPFVDDSMKAPLAMYIKISELTAVMSAFRSPSYVNSCGLHKDINCQEDILSSLAGCGITGLTEKMSQLKTAMKMMDSMNAASGSAPPPDCPSPPNCPPHPDCPPPPNCPTHTGGSANVGDGCGDADGCFTDPYAYYSSPDAAGSAPGQRDFQTKTTDVFTSIRDLFEKYDSGRPL